MEIDKKLSTREMPEGEESPEVVKVNWDRNDELPSARLTLGSSRYDAVLAGNAFYDGMMEVPEDERRRGIGSQLLMRLVEIAKTQGINQIVHTIQSLEGLMIITKKLKQQDRKYFYQAKKEISFAEAVEILKRKKEEGKEADKTIMVQSTTYIDQLEEK